MGVGFEGWQGDFAGFFLGLAADNSKAYFTAHRARYEEDVRGPMVALMEALEPEFGPARVSRPNRDIRFSADKSPYKTNIYASCAGGYVGLDARGLTAASGEYQLDPSLLPRFRAAVAEEGSGGELAAIVAGLRSAGYEVGGADLKRVPPPHPQDHPRGELLKFKRLFYWRRWEIGPWIADGAEVVGRVAGVWRDGEALRGWFRAHVSRAGEAGASGDGG